MQKSMPSGSAGSSFSSSLAASSAVACSPCRLRPCTGFPRGVSVKSIPTSVLEVSPMMTEPIRASGSIIAMVVGCSIEQRPRNLDAGVAPELSWAQPGASNLDVAEQGHEERPVRLLLVRQPAGPAHRVEPSHTSQSPVCSTTEVLKEPKTGRLMPYCICWISHHVKKHQEGRRCFPDTCGSVRVRTRGARPSPAHTSTAAASRLHTRAAPSPCTTQSYR